MPFPNNTDDKPPQACKYGHNSGRDATRHCLECKRLKEQARYRRDPKAVLVRRASRPTPPSQTPDGRRTWAEANPERLMLHTARASAKQRRQPCTITLADITIPEFCPLLGVRLERGTGRRSDASPSLDRLRPELGYVPGNVWVISWRANRLKNDATLVELQMLVAKLADRLA